MCTTHGVPLCNKVEPIRWLCLAEQDIAWRDLVTVLPANGHALFIGHSDELELALVAAFPQADHATWGAPFGHCEGARLTFGAPEHFTAMELLRR